MNSRIDKLLILCLIFVISLCSNIYSDENEWDLEIELAKQDFVLHERIWLDVTLTNTTSDTLRTHGLALPNHRQFTIELRDNNGNLIEYTGIKYSIASAPGRLLFEAGEQDYGCFNLLELFGSRERNSGYSVLDWRFPYIKEGMYTVQANFEGAISNKLTLNIVEPFGKEKEILKLIEKASSIWAQDNTEPSAQIFQGIVDKYPISVFAEKCYYLSRIYNHMGKIREGTYDKRILKKELLINFPNSGNSRNWLLAITYKLDDNEKIEIFNKFIEDYPNKRCSKFADQMRKRLLNKKGE